MKLPVQRCYGIFLQVKYCKIEMIKILFIAIILQLALTRAEAQLGNTTIGKQEIGIGSLSVFIVGKSGTPNCLFPGTCNGGCPVYIFNGTGNWDLPENWSEQVVPPAVLPPCYEIIINPAGNSECLLNTPLQTISSGAKLTIMAGKKFRVPVNMEIK